MLTYRTYITTVYGNVDV